MKLLLLLSLFIDYNESDKVIHSYYSREGKMVNWDSDEWNSSKTIRLDGAVEDSENRVSIFSLWNEDSLFFYYKVEDTDLRSYQVQQDHHELYLDDMVEILVDTQNDKDSCWDENDIVYHINLLGIKKDDRGSAECKTNPIWNGNASILVRLLGTLNDTLNRDEGYMIKIGFSWIELEQIPKESLTMGINFANGDNDGKGRQLFDWVNAWPMRSPHAYGYVILKK
tara:strand:+ start:2681 stop:3355 length:675 start_codon:yes stop_codon:yes gene_type:complete